MGLNVERSSERHESGLPGWVPLLACIVALVFLVWAFHGLTWLTYDSHPGPKHPAHVKVTGTTIPIYRAPTTQHVTCGASLSDPGAGPPPAACRGSVSASAAPQPGDRCEGFMAEPDRCWAFV